MWGIGICQVHCAKYSIYIKTVLYVVVYKVYKIKLGILIKDVLYLIT